MRDDSIEHNTGAESPAETGAPAPAESFDNVRDKPDGEIDPAGEAGWYLEREREARGLSLDEAGEEAGIHPYHLEAIEWGDMTCMPERGEALEMIGAYAQFLGFDPEPLVEHYALFLPVPPAAAEPSHPANPAPLSSAKILAFGKMPKLPKFRLTSVPGGVGGLVATFAAAMLVIAGSSYLLIGSDGPGPDVQQQASAGLEADPMPTASTGPDAADITIGQQPLADDEPPARQAAAPAEEDLSGTGLNGITALIEQNVPAAAGEPRAIEGMADATDVAIIGDTRQFGAGNGESRLTLKANAQVWVRIEDAQGNVVMTQMLMKGDTYRVPNRDGLVVIARDGGLLSYVIDGKEKGILGTPGEILVGRSLDLRSFEG
jgi:cytoskeleton protein RodZ